jgi:D-alanyl-D-alanine carboxypeptidase
LVIVALVCLFWVGYLVVGLGEEGRASVNLPSTPVAERPRPSDSDTKVHPLREDEASLGQETRKPPGSSTCDDLRVLVDRSHSLPPEYVPKDLVPLQDYRIPTLGSDVLRLRREAAEHLERLAEGAAADGEELVVASAFRSYEEQQLTHGRLKSIYGAGTDAMSAKAGHSQHQLGTAVDFTNAASGYQLWQAFAQTSAYLWLEHHAREYGYVLAYPKGKEDKTGYRWEPWHYRYVGVEDAKRLEKSNLSLQEFLQRAGAMPHC